MLTSFHLHMKSSEVCIQTRSSQASLTIQGQVTKHTTVKWPIPHLAKGHPTVRFGVYIYSDGPFTALETWIKLWRKTRVLIFLAKHDLRLS